MKIAKSVLAITLLIAITSFSQAQELFDSAKAGNLEKVKELVAANPQLVNVKDANGRTPLHWACRGVHFEVLKYLVENGADVNASDNNMTTPLISVSSRGHVEATKFLLDHGANVVFH